MDFELLDETMEPTDRLGMTPLREIRRYTKEWVMITDYSDRYKEGEDEPED
jgi:hypothetical protein